MGIRRIAEGIYKVRARIRLSGKIVQKQRTLTGTREEAKALFEKIKAGIRAEDAGRSLKLKTLGEVLSFYRARHAVDLTPRPILNASTPI